MHGATGCGSFSTSINRLEHNGWAQVDFGMGSVSGCVSDSPIRPFACLCVHPTEIKQVTQRNENPQVQACSCSAVHVATLLCFFRTFLTMSLSMTLSFDFN